MLLLNPSDSDLFERSGDSWSLGVIIISFTPTSSATSVALSNSYPSALRAVILWQLQRCRSLAIQRPQRKVMSLASTGWCSPQTPFSDPLKTRKIKPPRHSPTSFKHIQSHQATTCTLTASLPCTSAPYKMQKHHFLHLVPRSTPHQLSSLNQPTSNQTPSALSPKAWIKRGDQSSTRLGGLNPGTLTIYDATLQAVDSSTPTYSVAEPIPDILVLTIRPSTACVSISATQSTSMLYYCLTELPIVSLLTFLYKFSHMAST